MTVLVVDDEADMRLLVRLVLESAESRHKFEVVGEAPDGVEALRMFDAFGSAGHPDVVVLDNGMPHLTGIEVAQRILTRAQCQRIVLFSAHLTREVIEEAHGIGISCCVGKERVDDLARIVLDVVLDDEYDPDVEDSLSPLGRRGDVDLRRQPWLARPPERRPDPPRPRFHRGETDTRPRSPRPDP